MASNTNTVAGAYFGSGRELARVMAREGFGCDNEPLCSGPLFFYGRGRGRNVGISAIPSLCSGYTFDVEYCGRTIAYRLGLEAALTLAHAQPAPGEPLEPGLSYRLDGLDIGYAPLEGDCCVLRNHAADGLAYLGSVAAGPTRKPLLRLSRHGYIAD